MKGDHRDSADITVLGGRGLTAILEAIHSPVLAPQQKSANTDLKQRQAIGLVGKYLVTV